MSLETLENQNDVDCSAREILQFRHAWVWQTRKCESRRRESHLPLPSYITPSLSLSLSPPEHHSTWKTSNASIMPLSEFKPNRGRETERESERRKGCSLVLAPSLAACSLHADVMPRISGWKSGLATEAGQTVLGQMGTCRNTANGERPAGFGQVGKG